ncbi:MAG: hypothetical protein GY765_12100 [bacterium]|nr:hypothetical protein [bacterium]
MIRKKSLIVFLCLTVLIVLGVTGCKKSSESTQDPIAAFLGYEGCKNSGGISANPTLKGTEIHSDCIEYVYDGQGTLTLSHINSGFNCCPGEIYGDIQIDGNTITVTETESENGCHCLCLFDLNYEILNLEPWEYTIRVVEPYRNDGDAVLETTINLDSAASGSFCLDRDYYPWKQ